MRKKFLFPLIWIGMELLIFVIPPLFAVVYLFSLPSMIIVHEISLAVNGPRDTTMFVIAGAVLQAFLIGCFWDFVSKQVSKPQSKK